MNRFITGQVYEDLPKSEKLEIFKNSALHDRIRWAMLSKGFTSTRSSSGVDIKKLADAIDVSQEMARRYVEGISAPREQKLKKLAKRLEVSFEWFMRKIIEMTQIEQDQ